MLNNINLLYNTFLIDQHYTNIQRWVAILYYRILSVSDNEVFKVLLSISVKGRRLRSSTPCYLIIEIIT